jgi:hypothetical protein
MRRQIFGAIVAIFVFFASIYLARIREMPGIASCITPFRPASRWRLEHFGKFHSRAYKSIDGQLLKLYCYSHDSEQEARDWFEENLSDAVGIRERTPFFDERGNHIGDRAITEYAPTSYRGRVSAVVIVKGVNVYVLSGESLSHVLEFEKFPDIRRHNLTSR